jgi:hypothetical protein
MRIRRGCSDRFRTVGRPMSQNEPAARGRCDGRAGGVRTGSRKERPAFTRQSLSPRSRWRMLRASVLVVEPQNREHVARPKKRRGLAAPGSQNYHDVARRYAIRTLVSMGSGQVANAHPPPLEARKLFRANVWVRAAFGVPSGTQVTPAIA